MTKYDELTQERQLAYYELALDELHGENNKLTERCAFLEGTLNVLDSVGQEKHGPRRIDGTRSTDRRANSDSISFEITE